MQQICRKGTLLESTADRKEKMEKRRAEIVAYFHKYFVDPRTNLPHPVGAARGPLPIAPQTLTALRRARTGRRLHALNWRWSSSRQRRSGATPGAAMLMRR